MTGLGVKRRGSPALEPDDRVGDLGTQLRSRRDSDRSGRSRQPTDWSLVCLQRGTPTRCPAWRGSHSRGGMKEQVSALLLPPHSRTHPCSAIGKIMDVFSEKPNGDQLIATMANGATYVPK